MHRHAKWIYMLSGLVVLGFALMACDDGGGEPKGAGDGILSGNENGASEGDHDEGSGFEAPGLPGHDNAGGNGNDAPFPGGNSDSSGGVICQTGSFRCEGQEIMRCDDGEWTSQESCPTDSICENGACVVPPACTEGQTRCDGPFAIEACMSGQWRSFATCQEGCVDGICPENGGGGASPTDPKPQDPYPQDPNPQSGRTCEDIQDCAYDTGCWQGNYSSSCVQSTCAAGASNAELTKALNALSCYESCQWDALCVYERCSTQRSQCFFSRTGNASCEGIDSCLAYCPSGDTRCVDDCYETGTLRAQADYLWLNACVRYYCEDDPDYSYCLDIVVYSDYFGYYCGDAYDQCFYPYWY